VIDEDASLNEQSLAPRNFGDADQLVEDLSKSSVVGIAICDADLRYLKINDTMASFNGLPVEAHIGKTVPEIIGQAASTVEPVMKSVLSTGQSAMNVEIIAELPARREPGHWIANYLPVKDPTGTAKHVIAFVVEITRLRKFEQCLRLLMRNLPLIRDQVTCIGLPERSEHDRAESLRGSIELLEHCVEEMRDISQHLTPLSSSPAGHSSVLPSGVPPIHEVLSTIGQPGQSELIKNGVNLLTERETETLQLLAVGKSCKEVSTALGISTRTVESYRSRIMAKLSYHTSSELIRFAIRTKLIDA